MVPGNISQRLDFKTCATKVHALQFNFTNRRRLTGLVCGLNDCTAHLLVLLAEQLPHLNGSLCILLCNMSIQSIHSVSCRPLGTGPACPPCRKLEHLTTATTSEDDLSVLSYEYNRDSRPLQRQLAPQLGSATAASCATLFVPTLAARWGGQFGQLNVLSLRLQGLPAAL